MRVEEINVLASRVNDQNLQCVVPGVGKHLAPVADVRRATRGVAEFIREVVLQVVTSAAPRPCRAAAATAFVSIAAAAVAAAADTAAADVVGGSPRVALAAGPTRLRVQGLGFRV